MCAHVPGTHTHTQWCTLQIEFLWTYFVILTTFELVPENEYYLKNKMGAHLKFCKTYNYSKGVLGVHQLAIKLTMKDSFQLYCEIDRNLPFARKCISNLKWENKV